ncbi:hypothetical protein AMEX_G15416 [Astyanax mexicanus]|uniref:Uncharacterized protein n=1 Tax=Astyanax mexicanus TaxID=7994 RepID=A0A8T2LL05_ASTMX|nr:hypothetical protein AMEX_G15416 [Astyanax mexicanus]
MTSLQHLHALRGQLISVTQGEGIMLAHTQQEFYRNISFREQHLCLPSCQILTYETEWGQCKKYPTTCYLLRGLNKRTALLSVKTNQYLSF